MPCSTYAQRYATQNQRNALRSLSLRGILPTNPVYAALNKAAGDYTLSIGFKIPKPITLLLKLFGLSPGTLSLFHDADSGFFVESRLTPGAAPFYHHITNDEAADIVLEVMTPALHDRLFTPDDYGGE